ncbi:hypothetical protein ES703_04443 [subsurface metagenome]
MPEIKLAEPVRKLLGEKEAEIKELKEKLKQLESKAEKLEAELDALTAEKEELVAFKSKFRKSEDKLAKVEEELRGAKEEGRIAEVPLEELVYVYLLGAGGEIAIPQCARALGIKEKAVKEAIARLVKEGRVGK